MEVHQPPQLDSQQCTATKPAANSQKVSHFSIKNQDVCDIMKDSDTKTGDGCQDPTKTKIHSKKKKTIVKPLTSKRRYKTKKYDSVLESDKEVKEKEREAYKQRCAQRMVHSSNKLYLSNRLVARIMSNPNTSSPSQASMIPQSPIECINLYKSQFNYSNSKIKTITQNTRNAYTKIQFK